MRTALLAGIFAILIAAGLGFRAQSRPAAARGSDQIKPVPPSWYRALPSNPKLATAAYLARVPASMQERGDAVSQSRYWALAARIVGSLGAILLFLYSGAASALDGILTRFTRYRWVQAFVYAVALLFYIFVVTLPVEVCASYIRYRVFGFSDQPFIGWLQDYTVEWASTALFYGAGFAILMGVIRRRPRSWFLWAGLVYLTLVLVYTAATPVIIEPLTNTYRPLPSSPVKAEILAMAKSAGVPANDLYTDDASHQSRRLNGHVSGVFGSARIVLDDTALGSEPQEVRALAAHEMGHYAMHHAVKTVLFAAVIETVGFALIAWLQPLLLGRMGARWGITGVASSGAIAILWLLVTAWGFLSEPLTNTYARVQEADADAFSLNLAHEPFGLADFMIRDADIGRLAPTTLDLILFYDHPSDASRVGKAMQWRADYGPAELGGSGSPSQ